MHVAQMFGGPHSISTGGHSSTDLRYLHVHTFPDDDKAAQVIPQQKLAEVEAAHSRAEKIRCCIQEHPASPLKTHLTQSLRCQCT